MANINIVNNIKLTTILNLPKLKQGGINCIYENVGSKDQYVRQRNGLRFITDNPNKVNGSFFRDKITNTLNGGEFLIYGNKIYDTNYNNVLNSSLSTFSEIRTYSCELVDYTIFIDILGDSLFSSGLGAPVVSNTELNNIKNSIPFGKFARGCATLNGSIYVQFESGEIYNSKIEDASKWNALDFISSERKPDKAFYIDVIGNNVISINSKTIEFFYDGNTSSTGSRLLPRLDVSIDIGGIDSDSYVKNNGSLYFIGSPNDFNFSYSVYVLENFTIKKISTSNIDILFKNMLRPRLFGYNTDGRFFLNLTENISKPNPFNLCYDSSTGIWTQSIYPANMVYSDNRSIVSFDGDIYQPYNGNNVYTSIDEVIINNVTVKQQIKSTIIIEDNNFNTNKFKRIKKLSINSKPSQSDFYIDIIGFNKSTNVFKRKFNINGSNDTKMAQRLGRFKNIGFKIEFGGIQSDNLLNSSDESVEINSIEVLL